MNDNTNGVDATELPSIEPVAPGQQQQPVALTVDQLRQMVDNQVGPIIGCMIRGMIASAPGMPGSILLPAIARCMGQVLAISVAGDIKQCADAREDFRKALNEGMGKVPIIRPMGPGQMSGLTPANGNV